MRKIVIRAALGVSIVAGILAVTSAASAQTNNYWVNAKNQTYILGVAGGVSCGVGHGGCWLPDGKPMVIWNTLGLDSDWWSFHPGTAVVQNDYSDGQGNRICLGVANSSLTPGTNIIDWPCNGNGDQTWQLIDATQAPYSLPSAAAGCFVFKNNYDGQLMGVAGGIMTNGRNVVQWPLPNNGAGPATLDMAWCPR